jgi:hypothetical protein
MAERYIPLSERQYYQNQDDLHGVHPPGSQWNPFTTTPATKPPNTIPGSTGFSSGAQSFLTSPLYWNANVWSNAGAGPTPGWNRHPESPSSFHTITHNNILAAHSDSRFTSSHKYSELSQRTALPTTPAIEAGTTYLFSSSSCSLPYHHKYSRSSSCTSNFRDCTTCYWGSGGALYSIDDPETDLEQTLSYPISHIVPSPVSQSSTPLTVEVEPDETDDHFIIGMLDAAILTQSLAPPNEVPLRATYAPKEMRNMMSVFWINPFAMHCAGRGAVLMSAFSLGKAGPLEEEPLVFEFKLDDVASVETGGLTDLREQTC